MLLEAIMAIRIAGTTALITGANRGIGRALVEALVERGASKVYATARRPDTLADLITRFGDRIVPLQLDVTRPGEIRAAAAQADDVRLLINNAGIVAKFGGDITDAGWIPASREEFEVNVIGPWALTQAFTPVLAKHPGSTVVNISSVVGLVGFPSVASYSASKAALHSLTQTTRALLGPQGIQVIGVYPGPIDTDMARPFEIDKTSAPAAAHAILDGLEAGQEEIFPDPMAREVGELFMRDPKGLERQYAPVPVAVAKR
jgi:NAD(P)-dependent dehydrogenase (short-subunit alcohol dehydrogenase family)